MPGSTHPATPSSPKITATPSTSSPSTVSAVADLSSSPLSSNPASTRRHQQSSSSSLSGANGSQSSEDRTQGDLKTGQQRSERYVRTRGVSGSDGSLPPSSLHRNSHQKSVTFESSTEHLQTSAEDLPQSSSAVDGHHEFSAEDHLQTSALGGHVSSFRNHLQSSTTEHSGSFTTEHSLSSTAKHSQPSPSDHSPTAEVPHPQNTHNTHQPSTQGNSPSRPRSLLSAFLPSSSSSSHHHPAPETAQEEGSREEAGDEAAPEAEAAGVPKMTLMSRFRQAAQVIVEEKREERGVSSNVFAALLLNRPRQELKVKVRTLEKPAGVAEQEEKDMWKNLLSNVQHAVRWKAKVLRDSQGIPNTRQLRRQAREQQEAKDRARRHVFPGHCKTTYAMKKFLSREVQDLVEASRPENRRKRQNRQLKDHASMPDFVDRVRSTTAILRDFRHYRDSQAEKENVHV